MRTRTSQELTRPSSRLDSEGEEDEDDADKVNVNDPFLLKPGRLNLKSRRDIIFECGEIVIF